jgi:hypothetical protein
VRQGRVGVGLMRGGRRNNEKGGLVLTDEGQRGWRGMVRTGEAPGSLTRGPQLTTVRRERRGTGRMSQPRKERGVGRARRNKNIFIYSNEFQTSSNCFDQKVNL